MSNSDDTTSSQVSESLIDAARRVIEQAKGAVMLVYGVTDEQAFGILRASSQDTNIKLRDLATRLVAELPTVAEPRALRQVRHTFDRLLLNTTAESRRDQPAR